MKNNKYFVLRRKNKDSEGDKFEYLQRCTKSGIEIVTPFISAAGLFDDKEEYVGVISYDWERFDITPSMLKRIIH
jgi:hypothetical protein